MIRKLLVSMFTIHTPVGNSNNETWDFSSVMLPTQSTTNTSSHSILSLVKNNRHREVLIKLGTCSCNVSGSNNESEVAVA
jgi:hypothetical protein